MELNAQDYSAKQLREWLLLLKKPAGGNKFALLTRLNELKPEERGTCPVSNAADGNLEDENVENDDKEDGASNFELESVREELEMIRKERDLLYKENSLMQKNIKKTTITENLTNESSLASFTILKEIMIEYNGESDVNIWVTQFKNIGITYKVDEATLRALFTIKMKGKAQQWLHIMPDYALKDLSTLLQELTDFFSIKPNKLKIRKNFENRKWQYNETFIQYANDKTSLANSLNIPEDEFIEYVIDGIPDTNLRTHANLMCITSKDQLLRAFAKVELKPPVHTLAKNNPKLRCFNCNSLGHLSTECRKPKREPGSCYGCGSMQHLISECPQKKKQVVMAVDTEDYNEYVHQFTINLLNDIKISFPAECLIDSGSPVCFIQIRFANKNNIKIQKLYNELPSYFGINKTKLIIYGKIDCFIEINKENICFEFLVVPNESMRYDAVLGRNFMRKCGMKLVINNEKFGKNFEKKFIDENKKDHENLCKTNYDKGNYEKILNSTNECCNYNKFYVKNYELENDTVTVDKFYCKNYELANDTVMQNAYEKDNESNDYLKDILAIELESDVEEVYLKIDEQIAFQYQNELNEIFKNYYINQVRPTTPKTKCELKLLLLNPKPFHCSPRRLSHMEKVELQKLLDNYLLNGYIKESSSEFASPIVLVKKKTGDIRMCIDFRILNKMTAKDNYPLPLIEDLIDKLGDKTYFTKLDLKNGFFHVYMHPESSKFTSFVTPLGQYEFLRMPFGLKNAPSVFQRFVNSIFNDMTREGKVIIYMDDILIASQTIEEHFYLLKKIFQRLVENKLELRIDKCKFLQTKITYLGYTVTKNGIQPNNKGIEAIQKFPIPQNVHSVQSFLGLCSYFRKFVKNFAQIATPLYDLIKKNTVFTFGKKEIECFETLKQNLINSPILAIYNVNDETELHCDASSYGFGAILMQKKKTDNKTHPIFYFSKRTTAIESKYHSFELETLAIIYALQRFRIYLQGIKFKIVTDCNSLTQTLNKRDLNPRIARWALELQNYDYEIEHRPGTRMQHVDALSRSTNILVVHSNTLEENLLICQGKDPFLCNLMKSLENQEHKLYELRNGVLYKKTDKNSILFYVPKDMEIQIIHKYHDEMGHVGVNKTLDLIKKTYWFPKAREKVERYIQNCLKCISYSDKNNCSEGFLNNIPKNNLPFEVIHIDHYGPVENNSRSKKHILVIIDAFSKFVRLYPTKTTKSKESINALKDYFRAYSRPRTIISDRGTCFTSTEFKDFLLSHNVQHIKVATASPKANGQVERINRIIGPMIAKLTDNDKQIYWENTLQQIEFVLNNTINRSINQHPSVLLFGISQKGNITDELKEYFMHNMNNIIHRDLGTIRKTAEQQQTKVQNYNKKYFDKKRKKPYNYKIGDYIMIRNFQKQQPGPNKLIPKYRGPYKISTILRNNRFIVKDVDNFQQSNIPYQGVWAVENIRPWRRS